MPAAALKAFRSRFYFSRSRFTSYSFLKYARLMLIPFTLKLLSFATLTQIVVEAQQSSIEKIENASMNTA